MHNIILVVDNPQFKTLGIVFFCATNFIYFCAKLLGSVFLSQKY